MGTWGVGAFDNDKAMDWLDGLFKSDIEGRVLATLSEVVGEENYQRVRGAANLVLLTGGAYGWDSSVYEEVSKQLEACKAIELNDDEDVEALTREASLARHRARGTKAEARASHLVAVR